MTGRSAGATGAAAGVTGAAAADAGIRRRIDDAYATLTKQEQRAADFMLDHLDDLAVYSATEIAASSGVSKATVSRLVRRLGFADAQEVRERARELRTRGVPIGPPGSLAAHAASEHAALDRMLAGLGDGLDRAAELVAAANDVVVMGFRNSHSVALQLRGQLAQARDGVRIAPAAGQSVGEELAGLTPADVVVLVGFRRRPAGFDQVVAALVARQVPLVLLVDPSWRGAAGDAVVLTCPVDAVGAFDSFATAMSLVALLASQVLALTGAGPERVAEIAALYDELGELER